MTVATTATRASFSGDGSTVAFAWPYEYRAAADLRVVLVSSANVATLKTITTHYSVSGVSDSHGGYASATVTMVTAPASGETLVIYRVPSLVQETNVESESDPLYALNNALDLLTYFAQRAENDGVKLPIGVTSSFSPTLPDLPDDDGSTYMLGPNAARTALAWLAQTDVTVASVASAWLAVITAANLAAGRTAGEIAASGVNADITSMTALTAITGTITNDNAAAGKIGEVLESSIASGSAVSLTTATTANVTSISLTAGDWDVWGNVLLVSNVGTTTTRLYGAINTVSATLPTAPAGGGYGRWVGSITGIGETAGVNVLRRVSIASTTTYYLVANADFSASTNAAFGYIGARRAR